MKRIIAAVAVVAIVSSALAFAPAKFGGAYCASTTKNAFCQIVAHKTEVVNGTGTAYFKDKDWDGTQAGCSSTNCSTSTILYPQP